MVSSGTSSTRQRPRLSHDRITAQFVVDTWTPRDGRFVLWYYLTTTLSYSSIAIARNAAFPDEVQDMDERDVYTIVEIILHDRWQVIEPQLSPDGHFPKPIGAGWAPCDHGMCCYRLAMSAQRTSVMRSPNIRTRRDQGLADRATMLWHGTWDELLSCPREHSGSSAGGSALSEPLSSGKENRNILSQLFSSSASIAPSQGLQGQRQRSNHLSRRPGSSLSSANIVHVPTSPNYLEEERLQKLYASAASIAPSQGTEGQRPHSTHPSQRSMSSSKIVYEPTSPNPSEEERLRKEYEQRSSASGRSGMSRRSARSNRTPPEPAVPVELNGQDDEPVVPVEGNASRQSTRSLQNIQAAWFVLWNTIAMISCIVVLDPTFELLCGNLHKLTLHPFWPTLRRGFELCCTLRCVWRFIDAGFRILERSFWSRWAIRVNPPQTPLLSSTTKMACGAVACTLTAFVCYHIRLDHAFQLWNEVLLLLLPHQDPTHSRSHVAPRGQELTS
jgi:hypothetical protein